MLAIGRALMTHPQLLILDEPSFGIAPVVVDTVFETISQISAQGVAVLLIEQDVTRALEIASRGYFLNEGAVVLEGEPSTLLENDEVRKATLGVG
jgi:branched-chain amino acid transport system ATP-binding protein